MNEINQELAWLDYRREVAMTLPDNGYRAAVLASIASRRNAVLTEAVSQ